MDAFVVETVDEELVHTVVADYVDTIPTTKEQQLLRGGRPTNDRRAARLHEEAHEERQNYMHLLHGDTNADANANARKMIAPGTSDRSCSAGDVGDTRDGIGQGSGAAAVVLGPQPPHDLGDSTFAIMHGTCATGTSERLATHRVGGAVRDAAPIGDARDGIGHGSGAAAVVPH